jgi:hypothetical protein
MADAAAINPLSQCPLRVIFRLRIASELGLFIPQQRTSGDCNGMSVSYQLLTLAMQDPLRRTTSIHLTR